MKKKIGLVLFLVVMCGVVVWAANCPPSLPKTYVGEVFYDDSLLVGDFEIRAMIGDDIVGISDIVNSGYEVDVSPCSGTTGDVYFFINGLEANEQGSYRGQDDWGKEIVLNLTLDEMPSEQDLCGDGDIDPGEECDTDFFGAITGCGEGWTGTISCDAQCKIDYSDCTLTDPFCGDGICNNGETCSSCEQDCGECDNSGGGGSPSGSSGGGSNDDETPPVEGIIHVVSTEQVVEGILKEVNLNDEVKFNVLNNNQSEEHSIRVDYIGTTSMIVTIQSDPVILTLNQGQGQRVSLFEDNFYNLYVELQEIVDGKANLFMQSIYEQIPVEEGGVEDLGGGDGAGITGAAITDFAGSQKGLGSIIGILILIGLFVLARKDRNVKMRK